MRQGGSFRPILPDRAAGGGGGSGGGLGGRRLPFLVGLEDCAGSGVDFIVVLIFPGVEVNFINLDAVLVVQLAGVAEDIPLGQTRVGQGGSFRPILPNRAAGGGGNSGGGLAVFGVWRQLHSVEQLCLRLPHASGGGINLILVLQIPGAEVDVVYLDAVLNVRLAGVAGDIAFRQPRVGEGDFPGLLLVHGLSLGGLRQCGVLIRLFLIFNNVPGGGAEAVFVVIPACGECHVVNRDVLFSVLFKTVASQFLFRYLRMA